MEQISEQIVQEIKQRRLSPRPRWQFYLLNGLWWLSAGLMIIGGGLALALVLNSFNTNDWSWAEYQGGWLSLALSALPAVWLLGGLGLLIFGDYNLSQTKNAYRWSKATLLLTVLALSLALAFGLERLGLAQELDEALSPNLPQFLMAPAAQDDFWHKPERGLIMGVIINSDDDRSVIIRDADGKLWQVEIEEGAQVPSLNSPVGAKIKVFGSGNDKQFKARKIKGCFPGKPGCRPERKTIPTRIIRQQGPQTN